MKHTRNEPNRQPRDPHQSAVEAVQELFRRCPREAADWLYGRGRDDNNRVRIIEASYIEQPRPGPAYVVPAAAPEAPQKSAEELVNRAIGDAVLREVEREAKAGGAYEVKVVHLDLAEARRQAVLLGGCDVELRVQAQKPDGEPFEMLLGFLLPGPGDDGRKTSWTVLNKSVWQMHAWRATVGKDKPELLDRPCLDRVPLYLWPSTGLRDPQENCSVFRADDKLPGPVGSLFGTHHMSDAAREQNRVSNRRRLEFHQNNDRERRAAAERRLEQMGDAGITDAELRALCPRIDIELDQISMLVCYQIVRLWDLPIGELIDRLPPECVGLALFGHRAAGTTAVDVLQRCAWKLRGSLQGATPERISRAVEVLRAVACAHIDVARVERTLTTMKLW